MTFVQSYKREQVEAFSGRAGADSKTKAVHKLVATSKAALTDAFSIKGKASVEYERAGGAGVETRWTEPAAFSRTDRMLQYSSSAMAAYAVTEAGPTATTTTTAVAAVSDVAALKPATVVAREKSHRKRRRIGHVPETPQRA